MLHYFLTQYIDQFSFLNLFRYITFRTGAAIFTSFFLCILFGERIISWLKSLQNEGQPIREYLHNGNLEGKKGTPTMGGIMILGSVIISSLLWTEITNLYVWVVLFVAVGFGVLGLVDDYAKLTKKSHAGIKGKAKLAGQLFIGIVAIYLVSIKMPLNLSTHLAVPFFKNLLIDLSLFFYVFAAFVIVGTSNAVNLTDGLDGLATGCVMIAVCCFGLIAYLAGNVNYSEYLQLHAVPDAGELSVICGAIFGAGLGFLWFNAQPAQVFMGDTGSLSLGGILGTMAVITKHEIVLAIIGGVFVMETMSVILQVFFFKRTGKRIFLMSPIHHHFEKKGWKESKIVIRFWIMAIIFALIGLATLKLR